VRYKLLHSSGGLFKPGGIKIAEEELSACMGPPEREGPPSMDLDEERNDGGQRVAMLLQPELPHAGLVLDCCMDAADKRSPACVEEKDGVQECSAVKPEGLEVTSREERERRRCSHIMCGSSTHGCPYTSRLNRLSMAASWTASCGAMTGCPPLPGCMLAQAKGLNLTLPAP
jgi:hypothetical protein